MHGQKRVIRSKWSRPRTHGTHTHTPIRGRRAGRVPVWAGWDRDMLNGGTAKVKSCAEVSETESRDAEAAHEKETIEEGEIKRTPAIKC